MDEPATPRREMPRTSVATVLGLTALLVAGLLSTVGARQPALVGLTTGVLLALSLWLSGWERWRAVGVFLASLLVLPVAVGLSLAGVGSIVSLGSAMFPVATEGGIRPTIVRLFAQVFVVLGCVLAVFGASAGVRGVLDADRMGRYGGVVVRTTTIPFLVGTALFLRELIAYLQTSADAPGVQQVVGGVLARVLVPVFDPVPGQTHLPLFCLLLALSAGATARGVDALPVAELVPQTADAPDVAGAVQSAERTLRWVGRGALGAVFATGSIELVFGKPFFASTLPVGLYRLLVGITAAPGLRRLLWWLFVANVAISVAVWFLRRTVQSSADRVGTVVAPYVGGTVIVLAVLAVAGPAMEVVESTLLETPAAPAIEQLFVPVLEFYGRGTIALVLVVVSLFSVSSFVGLLWLALTIDYLSDRTAGVTLAGAGLFGASAFAAALDSSTWLVLAGLVGGLLVWDAGEFGTAIGREVGTAAQTRRTELVHTGGTVAVGGVGAVLSLGLVGLARGSLSVPSSVALAGLVVCIVAVVALAAALR